MSPHSSQTHSLMPSIGPRIYKERYDERHPQFASPALTGLQERGRKTVESVPRVYENPLKYARKHSPSPGSPANRIHSPNPPKRSGTASIMPLSISSVFPNKENQLPGSKEAKFASYTAEAPNPWPAGSAQSPPQVIYPSKKTSDGPLTRTAPGSISTGTKPLRSILISSSSVSSHIKRRCELSRPNNNNIPSSDQVAPKSHRTQEAHASRQPQGHKSSLRSRSARHIPVNTVTTQDLDCHRREVHAAVSSLGSRVGALENTIAATLPVVVEARLLWMENAVLRAPRKLGITRHAFYGNPRYEIFTRRIRTRAHYLGLTLDDLEYLQERLDSLGSQSTNQETLLISPFGGTNESGDKTMVEAYRQDSKHGAYARRIWRVCYESVYSVDETWMLPVPIPDNPTLVEKIRGWLHRS